MVSRHTDTSQAEAAVEQLITFRRAAYECLELQADGLFELCDALLWIPQVSSFVELSLSPAFRRKWPSTYEAINLGKTDRRGFRQLLLEVAPGVERPIWGIDHSCWLRPYAPTVRDRGFQYSPTRAPGGKPVGIGHVYSTLCVIPESQGSWALPLDNRRVPSFMTPLQMGVKQIKEAIHQTTQRPLILGDSEYGSASFLKPTHGIPADFLLRIRPNRVLRGAPPPYGGMGRPKEHGAKFVLKDPKTWPVPNEEISLEDSKLGQVLVQCWQKIHLKDAPQQEGILIRVHRPDAQNTKRDPQDLWLLFVGETPPPLSQAWKLYLRRFALEHFYRFAKQTLLWTAPKPKEPEAGQRWSDLVTLAYWQLWLARPILEDCPLPWQKPQQDLTPGRALRAMGGLLHRIGTPAKSPKPRGKSPGRALGYSPGRYRRYPVIKKSA